MKKIDVGEIIQVLANIGVIASIVLLAYQLQQNNKILAATGAGVRIAQATTIWATVVEQPDVAELLVRDQQNDVLTPAEEMRLNAFWMRNLIDMDYVFTTSGPQQKHGFVTGLQRAFRSYASLRNIWNGSATAVTAQKDLLSPQFIKYMEANGFGQPIEEPAAAIKDTPLPASKVPTP